MTAILQNFDYRNDNNTATIKVQKYFNKFSVSLWRIVIKYDTNVIGYTFSDGLKNKPSRNRIKHICGMFY